MDRRGSRARAAVLLAAVLLGALLPQAPVSAQSDPGADGQRAQLRAARDFFVANSDRAEGDTGDVEAGDLVVQAAGDFDCLESIHLDTLFDTQFFDISGYSAASDCTNVFFTVLTRDHWATIDFEFFVVNVDTDNSGATGCRGNDLIIGVLWSPGGLTTDVVTTPTCDNATWTFLAVSAGAVRLQTDHIAVVVPASVFPASSPFRWSLGLLSIFDDVDVAPDTGSHLDSFGGPILPGDQPLRCFGSPVTIKAIAGQPTFGTAGPDVILGTPGADTIVGAGGNDRICSRGGPDKVTGGAGADWIDLGAGNDHASGGSGADKIFGRAGTDVVRGGLSADELNGGGGRDFLFGQAGNDMIIGGSGNDELRGGNGHDLLSGNLGADDLAGQRGHDRLRGNAGPDALNGGPGIDDCDGGAGANTIKSCE